MAKKKPKSKTQDRSALEQNQTADVAWLANQWQEHPVVGLTPQRLHQLLTNAEQESEILIENHLWKHFYRVSS